MDTVTYAGTERSALIGKLMDIQDLCNKVVLCNSAGGTHISAERLAEEINTIVRRT